MLKVQGAIESVQSLVLHEAQCMSETGSKGQKVSESGQKVFEWLVLKVQGTLRVFQRLVLQTAQRLSESALKESV